MIAYYNHNITKSEIFEIIIIIIIIIKLNYKKIKIDDVIKL
jgi:hypothetical protein